MPLRPTTGNTDQTAVYLDIPMTRTVNIIGAPEIHIRTTGNENTRTTVMLVCLADGHRLSSYVIFRQKAIPKKSFPRNVVVHCQEKG